MKRKDNSPETIALCRAYRTSYLIAGFIRGTLTDEEQEELEDWIIADKANIHLFANLTDEENLASSLAEFDRIETEVGLKEIKRRSNYQSKRARSHRWKYTLAATLLILTGIIFLIRHLAKRQHEASPENINNDIAAATTKAILNLENGKTIELKSVLDTVINNHITVSPAKGELVYKTGTIGETGYNTLTVPSNAHYQLVLPDGSRVWLNAASFIRFPKAFAGNERKVFLSGEAFFEIAKDPTRPFRVVAGELTVEAVGTAFNVNAYKDEPAVTATLIEGKARVSTGNNSILLNPGEQLSLQSKQAMKNIVTTTDIVAWKNNSFSFHDTPLDVVMRQIERWYDAEVIFKDSINIHLNGAIERSVPLSALLAMLQETGQIKFQVKGKTIIVSR